MDILLALIVISAFVVVPGLLNYYANRLFTAEGSGVPRRWELAVAAFMLSFLVLTVAAMVTLLVSLGYDALRTQIGDFVRLGLRDYAKERPVALSGVLTAVALANMALMTALGWLRIPDAYLK